MRVSELKELPLSAIEALEKDGITELNEPQEMAVEAGLLDGKNLVVSAPTASGKTLIAELAILNAIINKKKKAVYLVPLKALGSEKYREFKKKYFSLGISVALSMGGYDSAEPDLAGHDIIIATCEKMDSLLRHGIEWVKDIGLVVADEIHLLGDISRGPTLEIVLTRLRMLSSFQVLALSATISNSGEIAGWLSAELVESAYRPVHLSRGLYYGKKIEFEGENVDVPENGDMVSALAKYIVSRGKQGLIFVNSRPSAEAEAEKLSAYLKEFSPDNKKLSEKVLHALEHPTRQCRRLAHCVLGGAAFHHAGLVHKQREGIEEAFKKGKIKIICATPTLAAGVNLPSTYVVIRDTKRFQSGYGMRPLPVLEVEQMCGRAGRPRYDTEGYAIILAKTEYEAGKLYKTYFRGEPEKIFSQMALEPALRMHVLSMIATGGAESDEDIVDFLAKSFYAHQYSDLEGIRQIVRRICGTLAGYGLVTISKVADISSSGLYQTADSYREIMHVRATDIGRRVAELYIDPETAHLFMQGINKLSKNHPPLSFLHLAAYSSEMRPLLRTKPADFESLFSGIGNMEAALVVPKEYLYDEEEFLSSVKSALLLEAWADEENEDDIMEKFSATPGEIRVRLSNADWLLYSMQEMCILLSRSEIYRPLQEIRARLKHGVRAELLDLVRIRGIGRVKARKLFRLGAKNLRDMRNIPYAALAKEVGPKLAEKLKERVGQKVKDVPLRECVPGKGD